MAASCLLRSLFSASVCSVVRALAAAGNLIPLPRYYCASLVVLGTPILFPVSLDFARRVKKSSGVAALLHRPVLLCCRGSCCGCVRGVFATMELNYRVCIVWLDGTRTKSASRSSSTKNKRTWLLVGRGVRLPHFW